MTRLRFPAIVGMLTLSLCLGIGMIGHASTLVPQTAVPGDCIPQFQTSLPVFGPAGPIPRVNASTHRWLTVNMKEFDQSVLPGGSIPLDPANSSTPQACADVLNAGWPTLPSSVTFGPTRVWGYEIRDTFTNRVLGPAHWPAVTVESQRFKPTWMTYVNQLPSFNKANSSGPPYGPGLVQGLITVDQAIHWADPLGTTMMNGCMDAQPLPLACQQPYTGPVPAVPHLHGGEVPSQYDGGPEAWFTPNGLKGKAYRTALPIGPDRVGNAVYYYPNFQEPGTLWFHDHALGATRTNVYSGMATFYFLRQKSKEPKNLPSGAQEIEMAIQDRQFDTNGQLFFPDGSGPMPNVTNLNGPPPNPNVHPFWIPEFIGDVAIVNGAPWPSFNVEPKRYRFRLLDGSNARMYNLTFGGAPVYVIGMDDAYLDSPVPVNSVFIAPGERADVIVDFSSMAGSTVTVTNDAPVPFPMGLVPGSLGQAGMAQIMQFNVGTGPVADTSCDPANGGCTRPKPMVRLTDGNGNIYPGVKIDKKRQLVLKEVEGAGGGPDIVLVNNTKWDGTKSPQIAAQFPRDGVSELPRQGSVELWEIINLTVDAHPMHTHLTQFQVLNRQTYNPAYLTDWFAAFPAATSFNPLCTGGVYCPEYGPPFPYKTLNADGALGGNLPLQNGSTNYLIDPSTGQPYPATPPAPEESGWKDTAKAYPGQVMRILVRWTPTGTPGAPNVSLAGKNFYPFDPTSGPGYVWHCHIVDHEDNEMMRPYKVTH